MAAASNLVRPQGKIASIRASVLAPLMHELDRKQGKTDVLLACHGVLRSQLTDPYAFVPIARYIAIFEEAAGIVGDPVLGARLGAAFKPADIGPIGILFSTSSTVRLAFSRLSKYVTALQGATHSGLMDEGDTVVWSYKIEDPRMWPRHQDAEFTLAASSRLVQTCFHSAIKPLEVHFEHAAPRDTAPLQRIFQCPLEFGQSGNRLVFDRTDADRIHRAEDRDLTAVLERHIGDLLSQADAGKTLSEHVLKIIDIYLGHKPITIRTVSDELRLSARTLQRHLSEEGTSLRSLIRRHRCEIAEQHIGEGGISIARIAETLGYADSTVFWRAFKVWTGETPSQHRR